MRNLAAVRDLDAGRRAAAKRNPYFDMSQLRVQPYWDPTCQEDEHGNLNVAAAAATAVAGWCITGAIALRRGLLSRLQGVKGAKALVDNARATRLSGDLLAHDNAVHELREVVEQQLISEAKAGKLALAK